MAAITLSLLRTENNGVVYADPAKPTKTVRFRNTQTNKTLNGVNTKNYLTEIIVNDQNPVTLAGSVTANDAVSVRIRVSGCAESEAAITAILAALADKLDNWSAEHVFVGFSPTTAPVVPLA